jgi:predicted dinucleotide-binding enzyme
MKNIGIIGSGNIGAGLARRLCSLHYGVMIANSRGPDSLTALARETGATPVTVMEAMSKVDILVLAVPFAQNLVLRDMLHASPSLPCVIIDTANYIPQRDGHFAEIDEGIPETRWLSEGLGVSLVKVFNSITADSLTKRGMPRGTRGRISLPIAGDDTVQKTIVMRLVDELGFDPYDAGGLSSSWRQQPGQPAYASDPTSEELPRLLARADLAKGPIGRDRAMALMSKLPQDFPAQELVRVARLSIGLDTWKPRSWLAGVKLLTALTRRTTK